MATGQTSEVVSSESSPNSNPNPESKIPSRHPSPPADMSPLVISIHSAFAAHAMQGLLMANRNPGISHESIAVQSWDLADAMLKGFVARHGEE